MSLSKKIAAEVDDLVKTCAPPLCIRASEGPHRIDLPVSLATAVGVECEGFDFRINDRAELTLDELQAWGSRICSRLTYLMEPLSILEADPVGGEVIVRSRTPTPRDGRRSYYEARLGKAGHLRFDRVVFQDATRIRRVVSCQFTNEVLERLIDDLAATAP